MALHFMNSSCWKQHLGKLKYLRCFSLTCQHDNIPLKKSDYVLENNIFPFGGHNGNSLWYSQEQKIINRKRREASVKRSRNHREDSLCIVPFSFDNLYFSPDSTGIQNRDKLLLTNEECDSYRKLSVTDNHISGEHMSNLKLLPTAQYLTLEITNPKTHKPGPLHCADCHGQTTSHQKCKDFGDDKKALDVMYCSGGNGTVDNKKKEPVSGLPTMEQLIYVQNYFVDQLPSFFVKAHNYEIYDVKNFTFIDNYRGKELNYNFSQYVFRMNCLKLGCYLKFLNVHMNVLGITSQPEDGTLQIRWQIQGIPQTAILKKFITPGKFRQYTNELSVFYDGVSVMHVNSNGKIYRHRVDRMMPDEGVSRKSRIARTGAALLDFMPKQRPVVSIGSQ